MIVMYLLTSRRGRKSLVRTNVPCLFRRSGLGRSWVGDSVVVDIVLVHVRGLPRGTSGEVSKEWRR